MASMTSEANLVGTTVEENAHSSKSKQAPKKVCEADGCGKENSVRSSKCVACNHPFTKKKFVPNVPKGKINTTKQFEILTSRITTLNEKADYDIVVLVGKKMKKGFSVETMCTPGFAKHFIGQDKKNRPKTGLAVMNLFKSHLQDYYKNPQKLPSSDKDSCLEHMEEEEEVADLEEQQESQDSQMDLDENKERYEDQPVAGSFNDNLMREDDHENEGDADKSVGSLMQDIQMTDDGDEREKTHGDQSGDSLMKNNKTIMEIPIGHFVPVFGLTSLEGDYWLFRIEKIMKTVIKGTYLNKIGPLVYEVGQADKIKPKNIICFEDGGFRSFSLRECENSVHLPEVIHQELTEYIELLKSFV